MDDTTAAPIDPNAPPAAETAPEQAPSVVPVDRTDEPTVDAFGLPPIAEPESFLERAEDTVRSFFTAARHPDDALTQCVQVIDNMHGSDDQRRKVVQGLVERFGG